MTRLSKRLIKWWHAEPEIKERDPVTVEPITISSVNAAEVPNRAIEQETREALSSLTSLVARLGQQSYQLRSAMGQNALAQLNGGK